MIYKETMKSGDLVLVQNQGLITIARYHESRGKDHSRISHVKIIKKPLHFRHVEVTGEYRTYSNCYLSKLIDYTIIKYLI